MLKTYWFSLVFTAVCLGLGAWWGADHHMGFGTVMWLVSVLAVLEVSLSFDNAVVNASVLRTMSPFWQKMFLTVGILIAVFGMRLVFPIVIVAVITGLDSLAVIDLALNQPEEYGAVLTSAYPMIATFGGTFLLMVFLHFVIDEDRDVHWLGSLEERLGALGRLDSVKAFIALCVVLGVTLSMKPDLQLPVMLSGVAGLLLFLGISMLDDLFQKGFENKLHNSEFETNTTTRASLTAATGKAGFASFLYLEVLDASFSFDGVIGAFAISRDVVIIMLGLAIGAIFVRSMTIDLVKRGTLHKYVYLEHGAHYAIGVLALVMFVGTHVHVPEVFTGTIGLGFILASLYSSVRYNRIRHAKQ